MTLEDRRQAISLHRRRHIVPTKLDVAKHDRVQAGIFELAVGVMSNLHEKFDGTHFLDWRDLGLALQGHVNILQSRSLAMTSGLVCYRCYLLVALLAFGDMLLISEEHFLELRMCGTNITVLVTPLVFGGIGSPRGQVRLFAGILGIGVVGVVVVLLRFDPTCLAELSWNYCCHIS